MLTSALILIWWAPPLGWWKDGGQLVSAVSTLGIPHPSGFPGYIILGKAISWLPFGPISFKVQLLSIATGTLLVGVSLRTLSEMAPSRATAWAAGFPLVVCLMSAHLFVLHSTTPEVYTPTALFLAALVAAATLPSRSSQHRFLWMGLWTGVGLTFHFSAFLVSSFPVWMWVSWNTWQEEGRSTTIRSFVRGTAIAFIPFLAYVYLPLATGHDPWRNWGNPDSLAGVWDHITASSIRAAFTGDMLSSSPIRIWTFAVIHVEALWESVGLLLIFAPLGGLLAIVRQRTVKPLAVVLLGVLVADGLFTVLINPMGIEDRQTGLHSVWAIAGLSGVLLLSLCEEKWTKGRLLSPPILSLVVAALSATLLQTGGNRSLDRSHINFPERYQNQILRTTPPNALVLAGSDDTLGTLNQALGTDHARPDIQFIALPHVYSLDELEHWQRLYGTQIVPAGLLEESLQSATPEGWLNSNAQLKWLKSWLEQANVPVLWGVGEQEFDRLTSPHLDWNFPLSRVEQHSKDIATLRRQQEMNRIISNWSWRAGRPLDLVSSMSLSEQARLAGRQAMDTQLIESAQELFTLALDLNPNSHRGWSDMGALRLGIGDARGAASASRVAIQLRPDLPTPHYRLMEAQFQQGEYEGVTQTLAAVEGLGKSGEKLRIARLMGARAYVELKQPEEALVLLSRNLKESPMDPQSLALAKAIRESSTF